MSLHVLVLAGGSGTRLWPLSRAAVPKHLLPLGPDGRTLLRAAVERVLPLGAEVHVVTVAAQEEGCREALSGLGLGANAVIAEPAARGTGPALGLATGWIARLDPGALVCSVHADAHVGDDNAYRAALWAAAGWARATDGLATVGLAPAYPSTGMGYIAVGGRHPASAWVSPSGAASPLDAPAVALEGNAGEAFVEKPGRADAEAYVSGGRYLWNLGLFAWPVAAFEAELRSADRGVHLAVDRVIEARIGGDEEAATAVYTGLNAAAVEHLVFEHARRFTVVRAGFPWSDLGSWADLRSARREDGEADPAGNVVSGDAITEGSEGCLVEARGGRLVAVVGAENLIVVDTGDAVLVVPTEHAQSVRDVVERLRREHRDVLL